MKSAAVRHLFAVLCLVVAAASQLCPVFSAKALFSRALLAPEPSFSFQAPEGFTGEKSVRFLSKGVSQDEENKLVVDGGLDGAFGAEFPPPGRKAISLDIFAYALPDGAGQRITVISGNKKRVISELSSVKNRKYSLAAFLLPDERFRVIFEPVGKDSKVVIEKLAVAELPGAFLPRGAVTPAIFLLFLYVFFGAVLNYYPDGRRAWYCVLGACAVFFGGAAAGFSPVVSPWPWLLLLAAAAAYSQARRTEGTATEAWLLLAAGTGLVLRWNEFTASAGFTLAGDAGTYYLPASNLSFLAPFSTAYREPFYIWLQKIWMLFLGPNQYQFRLLTVTLSVGIILLTYLLFSELLKNKPIGLLAAFLVAVNDYAVFSSALGERTEAYALLLLLFGYFTVRQKKAGWTGELPAVFAGAAMCLTWLIGGVGIALTGLFRRFYCKVPARQLLVSAALTVLLVSPHLAYEHRTNGDMFYTLNKSVNYFRNSELLGNPLNSGKKTTWLNYLEERGGLTIIKRTVRGYISIFLDPAGNFNKIFMGFHYTQWYSYLVFPFYLAGLLLAVKEKRIWLFALMLAFTHAFPYNLDDIRDPRLLFFLCPFFACFIAIGACRACGLVFKALKSGAPAAGAALRS